MQCPSSTQHPQPGGEVKCQQISGGDGFATMGDGTQTYIFSFGPLSGLQDIKRGMPGTQTADVFNKPYIGDPNNPNDPDAARGWIANHFGASSSVPSYRALFEREGVRGGADVAVVGDEHHVEQQLRRFAEAGATEFIAVPFGPHDQIARTINHLGHLNQTRTAS